MASLNYPCDEGVVRSKGDEAPCSFTAGLWILAGTIIGSAMAFIDGTVGFGDPLVLVTLTLGALALVAFVLAEGRVGEPMMPLSLYRSRNFSGANLLTLFLYAGLGGALYFLPFNLIQAHGYSATAAGAPSCHSYSSPSSSRGGPAGSSPISGRSCRS